MIFLALLAIATAGTAAVSRGRRDRRTIARLGLGIALAAAGASHFANPTPFEQHLPPWMPAVDLVVALSGVAEVLLGVALIARWPSMLTIGRATAAFFVAVFPANAYVAIADVEVDGQPGGLYPWIRLPFQALFISWALWSTLPARVESRPATHGAMPPLPWKTGPDVDRVIDADTIAMASLLELRRLRDAPGFLAAALRLRRLFGRSEGAIRLSLVAIPLRRTFWTLSQWSSQAELEAYARHPIHVEIMRRYGTRMAESTFASWTEPHSSQPSWKRAHSEINAARDGAVQVAHASV